MLSEPAAWQRLMSRLVTVQADYLAAQVRAGAQALQVFDSWAGRALGRAITCATSSPQQWLFARWRGRRAGDQLLARRGRVPRRSGRLRRRRGRARLVAPARRRRGAASASTGRCRGTSTRRRCSLPGASWSCGRRGAGRRRRPRGAHFNVGPRGARRRRGRRAQPRRARRERRPLRSAHDVASVSSPAGRCRSASSSWPTGAVLAGGDPRVPRGHPPGGRQPGGPRADLPRRADRGAARRCPRSPAARSTPCRLSSTLRSTAAISACGTGRRGSRRSSARCSRTASRMRSAWCLRRITARSPIAKHGEQDRSGIGSVPRRDRVRARPGAHDGPLLIEALLARVRGWPLRAGRRG